MRRCRGQALIEFALIFLALYLLLAVTIEFGRAIFSAQVLQDSARIAAREIALRPLSPLAPAQGGLVFADPTHVTANALDTPSVMTTIYDEAWLVVAYPGNTDTTNLFLNAPLVNQMLAPLYIYDSQITINGQPTLHYPGAVVNVAATAQRPQHLSVLIPQVVTTPDPSPARPLTGFTPYEFALNTSPNVIEWLPVVQEVPDPNSVDGSNSFYPLADGGYVVLRINFPFQSAALTAYHNNPPSNPSLPADPNFLNPVLANDSPNGFDQMGGTLPANNTLYNTSDDGQSFGVYAGAAGLGRLYALGNVVRPYRKIITVQAVFRRETFSH
jgi:Flp pilus assembly protein TadG